MAETRIDKLMPKMGFQKEDKDESNRAEMRGLETKDREVWLQLERQAHISNDNLKDAIDNFKELLTTYDEYEDMIITNKAMNVISNFGGLLSSLDAEKKFLISILGSYLIEINKVRVKIDRISKIEPPKPSRGIVLKTPSSDLPVDYQIYPHIFKTKGEKRDLKMYTEFEKEPKKEKRERILILMEKYKLGERAVYSAMQRTKNKLIQIEKLERERVKSQVQQENESMKEENVQNEEEITSIGKDVQPMQEKSQSGKEKEITGT